MKKTRVHLSCAPVRYQCLNIYFTMSFCDFLPALMIYTPVAAGAVSVLPLPSAILAPAMVRTVYSASSAAPVSVTVAPFSTGFGVMTNFFPSLMIVSTPPSPEIAV